LAESQRANGCRRLNFEVGRMERDDLLPGGLRFDQSGKGNGKFVNEEGIGTEWPQRVERAVLKPRFEPKRGKYRNLIAELVHVAGPHRAE
jgi:hypothetical protein